MEGAENSEPVHTKVAKAAKETPAEVGRRHIRSHGLPFAAFAILV
jgi:hypothetical protein